MWLALGFCSLLYLKTQAICVLSPYLFTKIVVGLKLLAQITLALSVVSIIIGIHQSFFYGILNSYWLFTGALFFLLLYRLIRKFYILDKPQQESPKEEKKTVAKRNKNKVK